MSGMTKGKYANRIGIYPEFTSCIYLPQSRQKNNAILPFLRRHRNRADL